MGRSASAVTLELEQAARVRELARSCLSHLLYPSHLLPGPPACDPSRWEPAYNLVARHRLAGLFFRLGREHPGLWPEPLQDRLRRDYEGARLWGEVCKTEVRAALDALRTACIPAVVLKGWALIPAVYGGDAGQRLCGDLDLLVRREDAAQVNRILTHMGYSAPPEPRPGFSLRYRNARVYRRPRTAWPFADAFAIAVHWTLLDTAYYFGRLPVDDLLQRSRPLEVQGAQALCLSAEDDLVYSCGHVALHHDYDESLHRYYEMARLVRSAEPALDWAAVAARASEWRLVVPVRGVTGRLDRLWPGIVPPAACEQIARLRPSAGERLVHGCVVRYRQNHAARAALAWLTMPGAGLRWRYLWESAFPGSDYLRQRYGPAGWGLLPMHYLRRAGRAVRQAARAVARR